MLHSNKGEVNWELGRQLAIQEAGNSIDVDPMERIRFEELARVAELHVLNITGIAETKGITAEALTASQLALRMLKEWQPLLDKAVLSFNLGSADPDLSLEDTAGANSDNFDDGEPDMSQQWFEQLTQAVAPSLLAIQFGSIVGQLAKQAFGLYELPLPYPVLKTSGPSEIVIVPENISNFTSEWSLDYQDIRLGVCIRETAYHTILNLTHVRNRLNRLLESNITRFDLDPSRLEQRLNESGLDGFEQLMKDPGSLLTSLLQPAEKQVSLELITLYSAIEGFTNYIVEKKIAELCSSAETTIQALRRKRVAKGESRRFLEHLFGIDMTQSSEQGNRFVEGVIQRAGEDALGKLWTGDANLPTPAEIVAPGLWLERIALES